jgi:hypothetical protein
MLCEMGFWSTLLLRSWVLARRLQNGSMKDTWTPYLVRGAPAVSHFRVVLSSRSRTVRPAWELSEVSRVEAAWSSVT